MLKCRQSSTSLTEISRKVPAASVTLGRNFTGGGGVSLAAEAGDKVGECLLEASFLYEKRRVPLLQCEALLQYARHLAQVREVGAGGGRSVGELKKEVCGVLGKVEMLMANLPTADQIMVLGAMARVCEDFSWHRKVRK